jgi:hypothetical protein
MKILSNDTVARIVLYRLYAKPMGVNVPNIPALKNLCGPKVDWIPDRMLATIVAARPSGLLGRELVTCKPDEPPTCPCGALDIELTDKGRVWVEEHSALRRLHHIGAQFVEHAA